MGNWASVIQSVTSGLVVALVVGAIKMFSKQIEQESQIEQLKYDRTEHTKMLNDNDGRVRQMEILQAQVKENFQEILRRLERMEKG